MDRRFRNIILGVSCALCLGNCASTIETRIAKNPRIFGGLSSDHQELVRSGRISNGMPKGAVFLAWGPPDRVTEGTKQGSEHETWRYSGYDPVYTNSFGLHFGSGYGYGGFHTGYFYHPDIVYLPYTAATVRFADNRVTEWEAVR